MHFSVLIIFFLKPYVFGFGVLRNFRNNAEYAAREGTAAEAVSFLIWSHIYAYWLISIYKNFRNDVLVRELAESSQEPYFIEVFSLLAGAMDLIVFYLIAVILAKRKDITVFVNLLLMCTAVSTILWCFYFLYGVISISLFGEPVGVNGDVADAGPVGYVFQACTAVALCLNFTSGHGQRLLRFGSVFSIAGTVLAVSIYDEFVRGFVHSWLIVNWYHRWEWFELAVAYVYFWTVGL